MNLEDFHLERTTIWSFPKRGNWATHSGEYRGNWSPYVPRNLILRYSKKGDWVLDQFVGSGTTLIEAKLLGRNAVGLDINNKALDITRKKLDFPSNSRSFIKIEKCSARSMSFLKNEKIDFICTHPPYANIIQYSKKNPDDISLLPYEDFLIAMQDVARESYRVLKPGHFCAFMMGDIRKRGNVVDLGFQTMDIFRRCGFILKEIIIKEQHNCRSTPQWNSINKDFLLLAHEYIFVLRK